MSLMSGLYVGVTGLQTANNGLNTVAHNISNVKTTGYTRQQVSLASRNYMVLSTSASAISYQEVGLGVKYSEVRQVRDYFLDQTYRTEYGREGFYATSEDALSYIEDLLNEANEDQGFSGAVSDLWTTIQELAKDPSSTVNQGLFISKAQTLLSRASSVYDSISDYQDDLNQEVKNNVNQVNNYAKQLANLNMQIVKIETGGTEKANDLRDQRNSILDSLSQLAKISYTEDPDGYVNVQLEGTDLVKKDTVYSIGLYTEENGFYTPYWEDSALKTTVNGQTVLDISASKVFDLTKTISSDLNTDIGKLKSIVLARGDHAATSADLTNGATTEEQKTYYDTYIAPSACMNVQAEFDSLIGNIVQKVNDILNTAGYNDGDFETGQTTANTETNLLFTLKATGEGWHISNINVNSNYLQTPSLLSFKTADGKADYDTTTKLKEAFQEEAYVLNPDLTQKTSFTEYYQDLVNQVTNTTSLAKNLYSSQHATVASASSAREQIIGVSSDEELQAMITYQNAYNASSRYITTLNDMLGNILQAFGA